MSSEMRFDLRGQCAVRVSGGPVAPLHAESVGLSGFWSIQARCGAATGWLLAESEPADVEAARAELQAEVFRRTAIELERRRFALAALGATALERLTHRLRADVLALQTATEIEVLDDELREAVTGTAREAQRRLTRARDVMGALAPGASAAGEPIADTLRSEFSGLGRSVEVSEPGERALALIPGPGWAGCVRLLGPDVRTVSVEPDPSGWRLTSDGDLSPAGLLLVAAGGLFAEDGALLIPAAPSSG
jgi:hypothetical protein